MKGTIVTAPNNTSVKLEEGQVVHYLITDKYGYSNSLAPGVEDHEREMLPRWTKVRYKRPGYKHTRDGEVTRLRHMIRFPRVGQRGQEPFRVLQAMVVWKDNGRNYQRPSWVDVDHLEVIDGDKAASPAETV